MRAAHQKTEGLENVVVLRHNGDKPSAEVLKRWRRVPWRKQKESELYPVIHNYFKTYRRWIRDKSLKMNVTYTIELHSTPTTGFLPYEPLYTINTSLYYFIFNKELRKALEEYVDTFNSSHKPHRLSAKYGNKCPACFDHVILELWHHPRAIKLDKAYLIVKDICDYLTANYQRRRSR